MTDLVNRIANRMSLREPQRQSLQLLAALLDKVYLSGHASLEAQLQSVQQVCPSVTSFGRDFPSLCFSLATGVGKTRLMGAFISYMYLSGMSRNYFVLAPSITIYEKLKDDFTPNRPKYVFQGISEFANEPPLLVTGENFETGLGVSEQGGGVGYQQRLIGRGAATINVFNIAKINVPTQPKATDGGMVTRIRRLEETIGQSYFDYLSNLSDLVVLMDEAHRYRATAGATAISELTPILGLEVTATPKVVGTHAEPFENIAFNYSLADAIADGFTKIPAVATRQNFNPESCDPNQLERIKLEDGIHHHEHVKAELAVYAQNTGKPIVKPFVLVVAQDTRHAQELRQLMESQSFCDGRYSGKVSEIHSKVAASEEDSNVQRLMLIEHPDEPTEIVIHVNKLKEGWDVTNLYTIIPLRASTSDILTEQTIGRGLRLPYGTRTGVEDIDRLTIIAHDRFQEIVDQANEDSSIIKGGIVIGKGGDISPERKRAVTVRSTLELIHSDTSKVDEIELSDLNSDQRPDTLQGLEQYIAETTLEMIREFEHLGSSRELSSSDVQDEIATKVLKRFQSEVPTDDKTTTIQAEALQDIARKVVERASVQIIDVPDISVRPVKPAPYVYTDFDLNQLNQLNFPPVSLELVIQHLGQTERSHLAIGDQIVQKERLEDYLVDGLMGINEIDYDSNSGLLYKLSGQAVAYIKNYLSDEEDVRRVLVHNQQYIVDFIFNQLKQNTQWTEIEYETTVKRGFRVPLPFHCTIKEGDRPRHYLDLPDKHGDVRGMLFGGFSKCCYALQRFDSVDGELRLAGVLENDNDVVRWMKPARGTFTVEYGGGRMYEPDFVIETKEVKYVCEVKMQAEMQSETVELKAKAAIAWCKGATKHSTGTDGKPWHYVLVPHDQVMANVSFGELANRFKQ